MTTLKDLLLRGFFPNELPPPFQTREFAGAVLPNLATLPADFTSGQVKANFAIHNLARSGTLRRRLGIPNPVTHTALADSIAANWPMLDAHMRASPFSRSAPVPGQPPGRALIWSHDLGARPSLRAETRAAARYILQADISRFYHSIYTHSVPWALHTKPTAKNDRTPALLGNVLDTRLRNEQDGQTLGIAVGPDTSLVIAESVLSSVDQLLSAALPGLHGFRFIDDYEFAFQDRSQAEEALAMLQETLAEFELALNPDKTEIRELPAEIETKWIYPLRMFQFRPSAAMQAADLVAYFELAFELSREHPRDPVLKYAIARLRGLQVDPANWPLTQHLLLQCLSIEPGAFYPVLGILTGYHLAGFGIDRPLVEEVINKLILKQSKLGHGSEVAWGLWTAMVFGLQIDNEARLSLEKMEDSVVALLALDAASRGLVTGNLSTAAWQPYMSQSALYEDHWLLSYEANVQGWLPSIGGGDHVVADTNFGFLKAHDVHFYDRARAATPMASTAAAPSHGNALLFVFPPEEYA